MSFLRNIQPNPFGPFVANPNPNPFGTFVTSLPLNNDQASAIAIYVLALQDMPVCAALAGLGLADELVRSHVHGYIQGCLFNTGAEDKTMERNLYALLDAKASPPRPLPALWKAVAVKALISWVQKGGDFITGLRLHPEHHKYLVYAGWTFEDIEQVHVPLFDFGDIGQFSAEMVQGMLPEDPFLDVHGLPHTFAQFPPEMEHGMLPGNLFQVSPEMVHGVMPEDPFLDVPGLPHTFTHPPNIDLDPQSSPSSPCPAHGDPEDLALDFEDIVGRRKS